MNYKDMTQTLHSTKKPPHNLRTAPKRLECTEFHELHRNFKNLTNETSQSDSLPHHTSEQQCRKSPS